MVLLRHVQMRNLFSSLTLAPIQSLLGRGSHVVKPEEAHIGALVRVREHHRIAERRGMVGRVVDRYGGEEYMAVDVRFSHDRHYKIPGDADQQAPRRLDGAPHRHRDDARALPLRQPLTWPVCRARNRPKGASRQPVSLRPSTSETSRTFRRVSLDGS